MTYPDVAAPGAGGPAERLKLKVAVPLAGVPLTNVPISRELFVSLLRAFCEAGGDLGRKVGDFIADNSATLDSPAISQIFWASLFEQAYALETGGQVHEALVLLKWSAALRPAAFESWYMLCTFLKTGIKTGDAYEEFHRCARRVELSSLDACQRAAGELLQLESCFRRGEWARFNGLVQHKYDYVTFEWWKTAIPAIPLWDGSVCEGTSILIAEDGGFGDVIQYIRYAEYFKRRGMAVYLVCQAPLTSLLRHTRGIDGVFTHREPLPAATWRAQASVLFYRLENDSRHTLLSDGYIDPGPAMRPDRIIPRNPGDILIGVKSRTSDGSKDIPSHLLGLLRVDPRIRLIGLQPEPFEDDLTVEDPLRPYFTSPDGFLETALAMRQLDLIVVPDSVIAHLAGAMAKEVWIALPRFADYRWMLDRADTPFYDSARLFRQATPGRWDEVLEDMARLLRQRLESGGLNAA
jgi:hypothetical protein